MNSVTVTSVSKCHEMLSTDNSCERADDLSSISQPDGGTCWLQYIIHYTV